MKRTKKGQRTKKSFSKKIRKNIMKCVRVGMGEVGIKSQLLPATYNFRKSPVPRGLSVNGLKSLNMNLDKQSKNEGG